MSGRKPVILLLAIFFAVIIIFAALRYYSSPGDIPQVVLPTETPRESSEGSDSEGGLMDQRDINPGALAAVISSLIRADSYYREFEIRRFWDDSESLSRYRVWAKGDRFRIIEMQEGLPDKNILIRDGEYTLWYGDDREQAVTGNEADSRFADIMQGIFTYEDVPNLDPESILAARFAEYAGEPCVFAEFISGGLGYASRIYISVETGLLVFAGDYDNGSLVYSMTAVTTVVTSNSDEIFELSFDGPLEPEP